MNLNVSELHGTLRERLRLRSRLLKLVPRGERVTRMTGWADLDNSPLGEGAIHRALDNHQGHLIHKWRHYPDVYDEVLAGYRNGFPLPDGGYRPIRLIEIGVSEGGSLEFWREWFGPDAQIVGIDIDPSCADLVDPSVATIRIGSQADPDFLRSVVDEMGGVDIVIDDGSHVASHQKVTFDTLWPRLSTNGMFLIEDTHTTYWPGFEGGLRRPGTAIEEAKQLVDDMHARYYIEAGEDAASEPRHPDLWSVAFYDSIIVMRKRSARTPARITRGTQVRPASDWAEEGY
ncbi:class I SAM-dependent methyltransferase [Janibacter sp. GXQ6167]|uniref:class I SAM-dependent methyltransferase n=1 Tax=Janibacter sp. GXQ6167 TaxID=3240791 RepID=UPI003526B1D3